MRGEVSQCEPTQAQNGCLGSCPGELVHLKGTWAVDDIQGNSKLILCELGSATGMLAGSRRRLEG